MSSTKYNTRLQSKKRKQEETSLSDHSDVPHQLTKNRKINKIHDDDNSTIKMKKEELCSLESPIFTFDPSRFLQGKVKLSEIVKNRKKSFEMIRVMLKIYEDEITKQVNTSIERKNQPEICQDALEEYICVHSKDFAKDSFNGSEITKIDNWLIYQCGSSTSFSNFQKVTCSQSCKTIHWLIIHRNSCSIRQIDMKQAEIIEKRFQKEDSVEEMKQDFEQIRQALMLLPEQQPELVLETNVKSVSNSKSIVVKETVEEDVPCNFNK